MIPLKFFPGSQFSYAKPAAVRETPGHRAPVVSAGKRRKTCVIEVFDACRVWREAVGGEWQRV
jgi:hypothetical protein